jgi:hypothetical protein
VGASDGFLSHVEDNDKDHYDFTATFTNMSIATDTTAAASTASPTRPPIAGVAVHLTTDTDSVSTIGTIRVHPPGPTDSSSITTGTSTSASIATNATMESQVTELSSRMDGVQSRILRILRLVTQSGLTPSSASGPSAAGAG